MGEAPVQYITIGKIVNTQGHKGEVRVMPLTDFPERFAGMREVLVEREGRRRSYVIEQVYRHKKFIIIKFAGVNDMSAAAALKGAALVVARNELVDLPEDTYYIFEIVGLRVYTAEGRYLGRVSDVLQTGANDVYVVEGAGRRRPLLIPALKQVVRSIDAAGGKMIVRLPEGLEED
mgnify:CR=1 FL=1